MIHRMDLAGMPPGCARCQDPVAVALHEQPIRVLTSSVAVFICPGCGTLVLDDVLGWRGSGVVFRATEEMIADYLRDGR